MFDPDQASQGLPARLAAESGAHKMKVTPLDLRQQRFRTRVRGYDRADVVAFLAEVADDYESALREADRLRQAVSQLEALLNEHREHERDLRNTLMTAQRLSDEMRANAEKEGQRIVREAEAQADLLRQKGELRLADLQRDIDGLKLRRRDAEVQLESTITALRNTLEFVRAQESGAKNRE